ncbi:MAG: class I tRNA ligase family protein, partial [Planctomycetota bacterium]
MFEQVPTQPNLIASEHEMLAFWKDNDTFNKLRAQNADGPAWSFLDGPITANNPMGVHHAWGRTLKDLFQRYHAMLGHHQRYQNGFDCQGLWVEVEVEKQLGFKMKKDIESYGIAEFVEKCKERVRKYSAIQTEQSVRLGYWMDWGNSYFTMSDENNYTIWRFLKKCHDRGLIYKGADVMPWCPRCGTGISQHEMHEGYREVSDPSVILKMPIRRSTGVSPVEDHGQDGRATEDHGQDGRATEDHGQDGRATDGRAAEGRAARGACWSGRRRRGRSRRTSPARSIPTCSIRRSSRTAR